MTEFISETSGCGVIGTPIPIAIGRQTYNLVPILPHPQHIMRMWRNWQPRQT